MTWSDLSVAAAFVAGAIVGTVATIRLTRALLEYLRNERRNGGHP